MSTGLTLPRILVVDDVPTNCLLLEARVKRAGFDAVSAGGGIEALNLIGIGNPAITNPPFELVILDIMMPDLDGIEVLKRIRKVYPPELLPVIMATGKSDSEDVVGALSAGANDYVNKPIDIPALLARIHTHLKLRETLITLQQTQDFLIQSEKMESIGRIAAGVAHEVKNPLYVLQMGIDFFEMFSDPDNELAAKTLHNMQDAVNRADTIIRGMLDFSRSEELKLERTDINEVLQMSLTLVRHEIKAHQIQLDLNLDPSLPTILMDRNKIEQVLINLITNACDAMDCNGQLLIRSTRVSSDDLRDDDLSLEAHKIREIGDGVMIEVIDDGSGIPHDHMLKIFDCFFTSKAAGAGTGLGLCVTKTIIDLHEGYINIHNNDTRGARACIILSTRGPKIVPIMKKTSAVETITKRQQLYKKTNSQ